MAASLLMDASPSPCWYTRVASRVPEIVLRTLLRVYPVFFDMVTTTPNWGTVLRSQEHHGLCRGLQHLCCSSPCGSSKAAVSEQHDLWSLL